MPYKLLAVFPILCLFLAGCEPKAIDPDSGRELSAPEWAAQTERVKRQADADTTAAIAAAKRESDRLAAEATAAQQAATANAAKAKRAFERAVARLGDGHAQGQQLEEQRTRGDGESGLRTEPREFTVGVEP